MELIQKLDVLVQAALQNQLLDFSTMMKIYTTKSTAEKQRLVENAEKRKREEAMQQQQQNMQIQQAQIQQKQQQAEMEQQVKYKMHQEQIEADILIAQINSEAEKERMSIMNNDALDTTEQQNKELQEKMRQFDAKLKHDSAKLEFDKQKHRDDVKIKEKGIRR